MELSDAIHLMLEEVEQNTFHMLKQGIYAEKMDEYFHLSKTMREEQDSPDLQRYMQLTLELRETERKAAQITGMQTMVRLYQMLNGEDKKSLLDYCEADFDQLFTISE